MLQVKRDDPPYLPRTSPVPPPYILHICVNLCSRRDPPTHAVAIPVETSSLS